MLFNDFFFLNPSINGYTTPLPNTKKKKLFIIKS